ncbi:MAG: glycosyltransferase family 4 protein [Candidatus Kerfeldbacteria bacterium]|nr:glycosyltransferase family 4 protein [Candidatus Kerfeldbacteria bacterium]
MRIGIDARFYGPGTGTGLGRYVERLLNELDRIETDHTFVVFLRAENFEDFRPTREGRFEKIKAPWRWYSLGEQLGMPRLLAKSRLDLMHFPHFNVPLLTRGRFVVTVHDLILNKFPTERASTLEPMLYWAKHAAYMRVIRSAIRRSRHVLAVSENTSRDIQSTYGLSADRISVTYEGCDPPGDRGTAGIDLAEHFGITGPFAMYVGTSYPHKNLERLIDAAVRLRQRGERFQVVLVGRNDFFSKRLQEYVRQRLPAADRGAIIFTGYVDDRVLNALYAAATLYVFPSLYEGFGLPGLEAMARGVPVAAARASCLPEIFGSAAAYFDPDSTDDLAAVVKRLMDSQAEREQLQTRGYEQVGRYSWKRMAQQTLDVYNRCLEDRPAK